MALIEELLQRGALELALANRNEEELLVLIEFLVWKIQDHRYQSVLVEVARILVDMYSGVLGGSSKSVDRVFFKDLNQTVEQQVTLIKNLGELKGQLVS